MDVHEPDANVALIAWLSDKDPDVRHAVAAHLNWDNAVPTLRWILSRPDCDAGTAATVLWGCAPENYAAQLARGEAPSGEVWEMLSLVLRRWRAKDFTRHELAWFADLSHCPPRYWAALGGQADPLALPEDLMVPKPGRAPRVPRSLQARRNPKLRALLWALGTDVGPGPKRADAALSADDRLMWRLLVAGMPMIGALGWFGVIEAPAAWIAAALLAGVLGWIAWRPGR